MELFVLFAVNGIFQDEKINLPLPLGYGYENPTLGLRYVQKLGRVSFLDKSQPRVGFSYPQLIGMIYSLYLQNVKADNMVDLYAIGTPM